MTSIFIRSPLHYINSEGIFYEPTIITTYEFSDEENAQRIGSANEDTNEAIWKSIEAYYGQSVRFLLQCTVETRMIEPKQEDAIKGRGGKPIVNEKAVSKSYHNFMPILASKGNTEQKLSDLLCRLDPFQIELLGITFKREFRHDFAEIIMRRSTGGIHNHSVNKPMYFAKVLHDVIHKEFNNVLTIQRLLISRSEIDLHSINKLYKVNYGTSLSNEVQLMLDPDHGKIISKLLHRNKLSNIFQHSIPIDSIKTFISSKDINV
ncbi:annexin [Schistosoma japonicum]|nr:annexin [Schistosoma japonicum]